VRTPRFGSPASRVASIIKETAIVQQVGETRDLPLGDREITRRALRNRIFISIGRIQSPSLLALFEDRYIRRSFRISLLALSVNSFQRWKPSFIARDAENRHFEDTQSKHFSGRGRFIANLQKCHGILMPSTFGDLIGHRSRKTDRHATRRMRCACTCCRLYARCQLTFGIA